MALAYYKVGAGHLNQCGQKHLQVHCAMLIQRQNDMSMITTLQSILCKVNQIFVNGKPQGIDPI